MSQNHSTLVNPGKTATQPLRIVTTLVLTGILSLGASVTLQQAADAAPRQLSQSAASEIVKGKQGDNRLPPRLANAVRQDLSGKLGIAPEKLRIIESSRTTWSNGCLGLPRPGEFCTEALVPGWRIVLSDGSQNWAYRTDTQGRILRLENQTASTNLPKSISNAVLKDASERLGVSVSTLRIEKAEQKTWSNPCIFNFGEICTREYNPIAGWEVTLTDGKQLWVYHTDNDSRVVLNEGASRISDADTLKPTKISASELPPPLSENVIFRAIASGGITGQTYQTTLMNDGRVMRVLVTPNNTEVSGTKIRQISRQEMQQFQQLLERQKFSRFHQLSYRALSGSADFITFTLTSPEGTTQYADMVQGSLPKALQEVIQAWNQIVKG